MTVLLCTTFRSKRKKKTRTEGSMLRVYDTRYQVFVLPVARRPCICVLFTSPQVQVLTVDRLLAIDGNVALAGISTSRRQWFPYFCKVHSGHLI